MTLKEMKQKYRALMGGTVAESSGQTTGDTTEASENPTETTQTIDPIREHTVIQQVMMELCCIARLPRCLSLPVAAGERVTFDRLTQVCGSDIFRLGHVEGPAHIRRADGTVLDFRESGIAQIDCYVYPEPITPTTPDSYEFELTPQVLEIMPYGIAAGLLSADQGRSFESRYQAGLARLEKTGIHGSVMASGGLVL